MRVGHNRQLANECQEQTQNQVAATAKPITLNALRGKSRRWEKQMKTMRKLCATL